MRVRLSIGIILIIAVVGTTRSYAQTATAEPPTATPTPTLTQVPYVYATVEAAGTPQNTRFDFVVTAGEFQIGNLLTWVLYSMWAMFFFGLFLYWRQRT